MSDILDVIKSNPKITELRKNGRVTVGDGFIDFTNDPPTISKLILDEGYEEYAKITLRAELPEFIISLERLGIGQPNVDAVRAASSLAELINSVLNNDYTLHSYELAGIKLYELKVGNVVAHNAVRPKTLIGKLLPKAFVKLAGKRIL
jgi:hypothetical protein